jgi:hypothetical protein
MFFHVLHARGRGESVALTMPWMGLKSDGMAGLKVLWPELVGDIDSRD